jgi:hypothetical protein
MGTTERLHPFQHLSGCVEVGDRGVCAQEAQLPRRADDAAGHRPVFFKKMGSLEVGQTRRCTV